MNKRTHRGLVRKILATWLSFVMAFVMVPTGAYAGAAKTLSDNAASQLANSGEGDNAASESENLSGGTGTVASDAAAESFKVVFAVDKDDGSYVDTTLKTVENEKDSDEIDYTVKVTAGSKLALDTIPTVKALKSGYGFDAWVVYETDGVTVKTSYTPEQLKDIAIDKDMTLHATFKPSTSADDAASETILSSPLLQIQADGENVTYNVHFEANGGSGSMTDEEYAEGESKALTANTFTRTGYTFAGWNTAADGSGTAYADGAMLGGLAAAMTLYAQWTANTDTTYTVNYYGLANGETDLATASLISTETKSGTTDSTIDTVALQKAIAEYAYYTTTTANTSTATGVVDPAINGDRSTIVNLYYQENRSITLLFSSTDATSGSVNPTSEVLAPATGVALPVTATPLVGYHFDMWAYTDALHLVATDIAGATATLTADQITTVAKSSGVFVPTRFFARFAPNTDTAYKVEHYEVSADGTSATLVEGDTEHLTGTTGHVATATAKTYTGYTYQADYDNNAMKTVSSGAIAADGSLILKLYYTPDVHTVTFAANEGAGTMAPESFIYGEAAKALIANTFSRSGYTFSGWNTAANGGGDPYADGANLGNLTADLTLYAQWAERADYQLAYNANGGVLAEGTVTPRTGVRWTDANLLPTTPTRTGYTFTGWNTATDGTGTVVSDTTTFSQAAGDVEPSEGTVTLYAQWTANIYIITFSANGGTGTMTPESFTYDEPAKALATNAFASVGHHITGWNTVASPTVEEPGTSYELGAEVGNLTADMTLYAQWAETTSYKVTYDVKGGSAVSDSIDLAWSAESAAFATATPTRTGYTFAGWWNRDGGASTLDADWGIQASGTVTYATLAGDAEPDEATITLYARWTANTYTVHFDKNNGSGTMDDESFTYDGAAKALTANTFTRPGYTFAGWNTADDGSGSAYTDGQTASNLSSDNGAIVTLYAQWVENAAVDIFYAATIGGSVSPTSESVRPATGAAVGCTATPAAGYHFVKWTYTDAEHTSATDLSGATSSTITADQVNTIAKNADGIYVSGVTFTATFEGNSYTVTYDDNTEDPNASGSTVQQTEVFGTGFTPTANGFERSGYTFVGWSRTAGATTADYDGTAQITDNCGLTDPTANGSTAATLYAVWTANTATAYTINYIRVKHDGSTVVETVTNTTGFTGTTDTEIGYAAIAAATFYAGYTYDVVRTTWTDSRNESPVPATTTAPSINGNASTIVNLYYVEDDDVTLTFQSENTDHGTVDTQTESLAPATGLSTGVASTAKVGFQVDLHRCRPHDGHRRGWCHRCSAFRRSDRLRREDRGGYL